MKARGLERGSRPGLHQPLFHGLVKKVCNETGDFCEYIYDTDPN